MRIILTLTMALLAMAANALDYTPEMLTNPNVGNPDNYVCDPGNLLSSSAKSEINAELSQLRKSVTSEGAVAIVPESTMPAEQFASELFKKWGLGKRDKDNGVLLLVIVGSHEVRIETGYGVEGVLPDAICSAILRENFMPEMKAGNIDAAVSGTVGRICKVMEDPVAAEELRSSIADGAARQEGITSDEFYGFVGIAVIVVFLLTGGLFFYLLISGRKRDRYHRALALRENRTYFWIGAALSLGLALPFPLLAMLMTKRLRNKKTKCAHCGAKMRKLSEEEDNRLLTPPQDLEERLKSVDYDVWECPQCGAVDVFAYHNPKTQYKKCPRCHTVAMRQVEDSVLHPATVSRAGVGVKRYECRYCGNRNEKRYTIPKKADAATVAAGIAASALSGGRGSGGGGGFNGGFGGGSSGGGGATGRW